MRAGDVGATSGERFLYEAAWRMVWAATSSTGGKWWCVTEATRDGGDVRVMVEATRGGQYLREVVCGRGEWSGLQQAVSVASGVGCMQQWHQGM